MLIIATCLWDANEASREFSRCYDETWVENLYDGFARNLTKSFEFILFTDRSRAFPGRPIRQHKLVTQKPDYGCFIEPFRLNRPMIIVGLDTIITGNCEELTDYCETADLIALPRDPFKPARACNGVALVPQGKRALFDAWRGENDMDWLNAHEHALIDDLFPGYVQSYKGAVKFSGLGDTRICYFHGHEKPHELSHVDWIRRHWTATQKAA